METDQAQGPLPALIRYTLNIINLTHSTKLFRMLQKTSITHPTSTSTIANLT